MEEARAKRKCKDGKRQGLLMVVLQRVGLISKTSLGSKKGFLIKFLPSYLRIVMIKCVILSLKR